MFTQKEKLIALSICHIFETSKPLGNSTTVAVLNDRAGISYGIPQATHKSGNLADVIKRYIAGTDESLYEPLFRKYLPEMLKKDQRTVDKLARNEELKRALGEAGKEPEMRKAQMDNVNERLNKAIQACQGSDFVEPLSLAVIYDSMNHGSWERIRDKINTNGERAWITAYVRARHAWLKSVTRLASTSYRTKFFLDQIATGNWDMNLPMTVHGYKLTNADITKAMQEMEVLASETGANHAAHEDEPVVEETPQDIPALDGVVETTVVKDTDGSESFAETTKNEQPVTDVVTQDGTKPYNDIGLKDTLKNDAKAIVPANVGFGTLQELVSQATGWPPWVAGLVTKAAIAAIVISVIWILYRFVSYALHTWRENEKQKLMAMINTDKNRKDIIIK